MENTTDCPLLGNWTGTQLQHSIGCQDGPASWSANPAQDAEGYLAFGPYVVFPNPPIATQASFTGYVYFTLAIDNNTAPPPAGSTYEIVAVLEVNDATAQKVIGTYNVTRQSFKAANTPQQFWFYSGEILNGHQIEFRVKWLDRAYLRLDKVQFQPNRGAGFCTATVDAHVISECPKPDASWTGAQLQHGIGRQDGTSGWSANPAQDAPGYLIFGPYYTGLTPAFNNPSVVEGTAYFNLTIDNNTADNNSVATLDAYDATSKQRLGSRVITRKNFAKANSPVEFAVQIAGWPVGHQVEFRVYWKDQVYIRVNKIQFNSQNVFNCPK
ncbi:hypothetical protein [Hymenobacter terrenus]|uniref:hypothetical protein n=1 Tax=Hymenobacter terrenus TaxID=1629124 RepID=UPI000A999675|nr:hypothetical protein [Hymenobacter terrenus]